MNARVSELHPSSSLAAILVHTVDETGAYVSPGAGSSQVSIKDIRSTGGTSNVTVMDSTQNSIAVTIREGSAAGSTLVTVRQSTVGDLRAAVYQSTAADLNVTVAGYSTTVQVSSAGGRVMADQNSTVWQTQAILRDRDQSSNIANITNTTPASTAYALAVREVAPSTVVTVSTGSMRVHQSTAADLNVTVAGYSTVVSVSTGSMRVHQSTAADLNVTVAGYSTTVNVSSLAGRALVDQNSTVWNTQARLFTSSGGSIEGSTTTLSTGAALGLNVRPVQPSGRQSTSILVNMQTAGGSTVLVSSVAGLKHKCFAYAVTSTIVGPSSVAFLSSAVIERWGLILGSGSSGVTGANLAVPAPAFLFETETANALNFTASSTGLYRVSVGWFTEA